MLTTNANTSERALAIDAICHSSPIGNTIQAVSSTAHVTMRRLLPLDSEGGYSWPRSQDAQEEDAAWEVVMTALESEGLRLHLM